jgi:hypothetical protein
MNAVMRRLMDEIERYLAAVDEFRAEGCEPRWLPEEDARCRRRGLVRGEGPARR